MASTKIHELTPVTMLCSLNVESDVQQSMQRFASRPCNIINITACIVIGSKLACACTKHMPEMPAQEQCCISAGLHSTRLRVQRLTLVVLQELQHQSSVRVHRLGAPMGWPEVAALVASKS